ncbi:MAG: EthD domain-containing protein, partial [Rhodospirillaceae bacterium]|nr:EthD domain-containing protein [Rhodospirillaceae bacterium]
AVEDFQAYWRGEHSEVVKRLPNIRRYIQSHALLGGYRKGELPYDGIAEIWVDDVAALRAMAGTDAYGAVQADEETFIDRSKLALILTQEHVIKDGPIPDGAVKNIEFVTRRTDMDVQAFQAYWRDIHGPLAARIEVIRRYVQSHTLLGGYRDGRVPAIDGCAMTWFDSVAAMRQSAQSEAYDRTREDEPNFLDTDPEIPFIITTEHVIVA